MTALYFSVRLKELRTKKGLTQAQVAERLGVARSLIGAYEQDYRLPSHDILVRLARMFNVTTDYLLCVEERRYIDVTDLTESEITAITDLISIFLSNRQEKKTTSKIREVV